MQDDCLFFVVSCLYVHEREMHLHKHLFGRVCISALEGVARYQTFICSVETSSSSYNFVFVLCSNSLFGGFFSFFVFSSLSIFIVRCEDLSLEEGFFYFFFFFYLLTRRESGALHPEANNMMRIALSSFSLFLFFFFCCCCGQGFRVLPVFSKGADEFFPPPKKFFFTSA